MNKTFRKIAALLCALLMVVSCVGCGAQNPSSSASTGSTTSASAADAKEQEEPFKITILTQTYTDATADDNRLLKELEENTNTDLDITFAPAASYVEKFVMTIASGEMPMLLLITEPKHSTFLDAADHGAFWDLTPYLENYPNLSTLGDSLWTNAKYKGKNYFVPRYRPIGRNGIIYRKDWMEAAGLSKPTTVEELYDMLKIFSEGDFDGNGKVDSVGLVLDTNFYNDNSYITSLFGAPTKWGVNENDEIVPAFAEQEYIDAITWYRELYAAGAINQDFAVLQDARQMFAKGNAGAWGNTCDGVRAPEMLNDLPGNAPDAELDVLYTLSGPAGVRSAASGAGFFGGYVVPKSSVKDEETLLRVLEFLDALASPETGNLFTYGQEGVDYTLDGDTAIQTSEQKAEFTKTLGSLSQLTVANYDGLHAPSTEVDAFCYEMWAELEKNVVLDPTAPLSSETWTEKSAELSNIEADAVIKYVMGAIDEAGYRAEIERWYAAGGDKVCEEFTAAYQESK